ncbi:MAG: hypothetical protein AABY33_10840 [Pseudomonadota bacterium]
MITLLGSFLGFISAAFPDLLKLLRDAQDRKHEITILQMQMEQQKQEASQRLEEIQINADITESSALYKTYTTGISWVDALGGTVRPVIAYSFFILYAAVKVMQFSADMPWLLWTAEDQAIFAGIISFYFGQRAMSKLRAEK